MTVCVPRDFATCPRCDGTIWLVETISDTLEDHVKIWLCEACAGTGTLSLALRIRSAPRHENLPEIVQPRAHTRLRVTVT